jgi:hypothetical protein
VRTGRLGVGCGTWRDSRIARCDSCQISCNNGKYASTSVIPPARISSMSDAARLRSRIAGAASTKAARRGRILMGCILPTEGSGFAGKDFLNE